MRALLLFEVAAAGCLPAPVAQDRMRNLSYGTRAGQVTRPLGVWQNKWSSGLASSNIACILLEEAVGVNVDCTQGHSTSGSAILAVAGCPDPAGSAADCTGVPVDDILHDDPIAHVTFEAWEAFYATNLRNLDASVRPTTVLKQGYTALDGLFCPVTSAEKAYSERGINLLDYLAYDTKWTDATVLRDYFGSYSDINKFIADSGANDQDACIDLSEATNDWVTSYTAFTDDVDGVEEVDGTPVFKCTDGWWFSPACRANPETCIPMITWAGYTWGRAAQWAYHYNWPLAIGSFGWSGYSTILFEVDALLYWWYPDDLFLAKWPLMIQLKPQNLNEQNMGLQKTGNLVIPISKVYWKNLEDLDPELMYFMKTFMLNGATIDDLMRVRFETGAEYYDIACDWVKAHESEWKGWINARCLPGEFTDLTADIGCSLCPAGTYSDVFRADECWKCPLGTFANLEGQDACTQCPTGTSTEATGTNDPAGCIKGAGACIPGQGLDGDACISCGEGTESKFDTTISNFACLECPAGSFCDGTNDARSTLCPTGHSCPAGSIAPTLCAAGSSAPKDGMAECTSCNAGFYSLADGTACAQCTHGSYSGAGDAECTLCDPDGINGFTTLTTGASSARDCTCSEGKFWNVRDDKCEHCRDQAFCPGGLHLPVAFEGKYALHKGSVSTHKAAQAAKLELTFKAADYQDAFYDVEVYNCASILHCPGTSVTFDFDEYGLGSTAKEEVRIGAPLEGSCPALRVGIACARCDEGYYGSKDCLECNSGATGVNVFILCVLPFAMLSLYRATTSAGTQRLQSAFILVSTCGMAAFFMQTIAVLDSFAFNWPDELGWLFAISRIFMFDLGALSLTCMHGDSFAAKYWASIMIPVVVVFMTGIAFGISRVLPLPEAWKMKPNQTFSMIGMFLSALYITLVKVVLAYFECPENPYAPATLAKYKDIVCDDGDRAEAKVPMAFGLVVYVLGMYGLFCWAAFTAPTQWMNVNFRERWKFMLTRWRPDVWYWGTVVMTRNLLVAFAGVIASEPRVQLVYVCAVVTLVLAITAVYQPWRAPPLNHYDVLSAIVLVFIGMLGLVFVSIDEELGYVKRLELNAIAERKLDMRKAFSTGLTSMIGLFMTLFVLLLVWTLGLMVPSQAIKQAKLHDQECTALLDTLRNAVAKQDFIDSAKRLIDESTAYDRYGLRNFIIKIGVDPHSQKSGTSDTISMKKAQKLSVKTMNTSGPPSTVVSA